MKTTRHFRSYLTQFFLESEMFQTDIEEIKRHILLLIFSPTPENRAVYEIMWENIVQRCRSQITVRRMRIACWIPKATNTNTLEVYNTYCISTATVVAGTRGNITFMPKLPVFS